MALPAHLQRYSNLLDFLVQELVREARSKAFQTSEAAPPRITAPGSAPDRQQPEALEELQDTQVEKALKAQS
jgi:hypothetical protein